MRRRKLTSTDTRTASSTTARPLGSVARTKPVASIGPLEGLDDDTPLKFGKYKGWTPNQVAEQDPGYIVWLYDNVPGAPVSAELAKDCEYLKMESDAERDLECGWDEFWKE